MDYIIFLKPSLELSNIILSREDFHKSNLGVHMSLVFFSMRTENEKDLISRLSEVTFEPFDIMTDSFIRSENFLMLDFSQPPEFLELHRNVKSIVTDYVNPRKSEELWIRYFQDNYRLHTTLSRDSEKFNGNIDYLLGREERISEYYLSKKNSSNQWVNLGIFHAKN